MSLRSAARVLARRGRPLYAWCAPTLFVRHQHPPRPVVLPRSYLRANGPRDGPRTSIVTPSYQQAPFLERTIRSVLAQRYEGVEYVVMDGGSTDGSVEILERYTHRLARWETAPDGGQAAAVNKGFSYTTGDVMAWLNADDLLLPGALDFVAAYFARHRSIDVIYGHRLIIDAEDLQIGAWTLPRHSDAVLRWVDYIPQETLFFRRRVWDRIGGLDESLECALDWDMLLRMQEAGARFVRVPRFLAAFRVHGEQKTQRLRQVSKQETDRLRSRMHGDYAQTAGTEAAMFYFGRQGVRDALFRAAARWPRPRITLDEAWAAFGQRP